MITMEATVAGVNLSLKVGVEDRELQVSLERLQLMGGNLRSFWQSVGEYMLRATDERFTAQKDPAGKDWPQLNARYRRRKKGPKILTERHRLRRSIAYRASELELLVGTNVVYGAIHQLGGEIEHEERSQVLAFKKKGGFMSRRSARRSKGPVRVAFATIGAHKTTIAPRPFLGASTQDRAHILELLRDHIARATASAG